ncbi:ABC-2 type transporter [Sodiomyces alkalinus F11]|uniref:ABC-2 type transporter n=1 Tax=Sodiomyces alkalinus (strain CBS 110278 / VKM F-3762 / F11) TaxID=1314773 RepID=A0A3N2PRJ0_SODAK|nr:ABC-2 type transporter [Sodiomyces alkalinus F11]ROT37107.1 ABC-2 type transporter [Sodiomyces alkalinus F11]
MAGDSAADFTRQHSDGRWGEGAEGDISVSAAINEFHDLERELTTRSRRTQPEREPRRHDTDSDSTHTPGSEEDGISDLPDFLRNGFIGMRAPADSPTATKKLGVSFKNLTVKGVALSTVSVETLPRTILNTFGPDLWSFLTAKIPSLALRTPPTVDILRDMTGTVRHGEIMLVLGRPGSGCSTFLKAIANHRQEYASVQGEVYYGAISAEDQKRQFRGEVVYCEEDDQHFPNLTVWQTLWFALKNKTRKREEWTIPVVLDSLLQMFGIEHTRDTLVGDAYVRGVSGGERKRVSLAETLATNASVVCWDNSTRGLDASTALSFAKSLRVYTNVTGKTTLVTLYQAGESIYELMDKVLVIDDGRMLFQGPAKEAKKYFEDLGYWCPPRQTTADFLTSIADKESRRFQPGREETTPKTPEELERAFRESPYYQRLLRDVDDYDLGSKTPDSEKHKVFEMTVQQSKSKHVTSSSPYTVSYACQVCASLKRQFWLFYHDRSSFYTKLFLLFANALIVGSLFAEIEPGATSSAFSKATMTFFAVAFVGWVQFSELLSVILGRNTIARQTAFAFYRPSAVVLARAILDIPVVFLLVVALVVPFYFLSRFDLDAGKFWIHFLFVYVLSYTVTAMYRLLAAFSSTVDDAIRFVGVLIIVFFIFMGFFIPRNQLITNVPWFGWITYVNPMAFGFEAIITNEFDGLNMTCSEANLVPRGPGAEAGYQGCSLPGSQVGSTNIDGAAYLDATYSFLRSNLWRNFGIIVAFALFFLAATVVFIDRAQSSGSGAQSTVFVNKPATKKLGEKSESEDAEALGKVGDQNSVFTFKDVNYTIPYGDGQLQLLDRVTGYAKSGKMIALMGSSGAGKTTLLNTLAQRQRVGVVSGEMLINGSPPGPGFQRGTGFGEQQDMHEGSSTVRESLEFSALLRQESHIPREEKIAYVDRIMRLLEMDALEHAFVSSLNVEQRKRITIGVELAAKPSLLLFLDEPTSGLDSQSAYSLVRFLRRLCDAGQAIICTIHQPSSDLIEQFDMILGLKRGGKTFYFGPVGEHGSVVVDYFAARGYQCPLNHNMTEFILEATSRPGTRKDGSTIEWDEEWRDSEEAKALVAEIDRIAVEQKVALDEGGVEEKKQTRFAAPAWYQCYLLTRRTFVKYWREPSYIYGRFFVHAVLGIFTGFTFWNQSNSIASIQNRMFTNIVYPFFVTPAVVNSVVANFFSLRQLWAGRELPSCTYGWVAFATASIVPEVTYSIVAGTLFWLPSYFPVGFPTTPSVAGYSFLINVLYALFVSSWGQWLAACGTNYGTISNMLPFFFVVTSMINGIVSPYSFMPDFWKYWIYYVNPMTWFSRGVLSATLADVQVRCTEAEFARFDPPPGQTCGEYAGDFVSAGGYLQNEDARADCGYCAFSDGSEYLRTLNVELGDKWPAVGYLVAFLVANWVLLYFFVYAVSIRGWTFGFGTAGRMLGDLKAKVLSGRRKGSEESERTETDAGEKA